MSDTNTTQTPKGTQEEKEIVVPPLNTEHKDEIVQEFNEDGTPKEVIPKVEPKEVIPEVIPEVTPAVVTPKKEEPNWREKFANSTRRNQIVESQFKELQKTLGDITKQEIPSDEEMKIVDPDWEYRSDFEKNMSIKAIVLERRQNLILNSIGNITKESEEAEKIAEYIDTVPELKGHEEAFIDFIQKPSNKGASMELLLSAFFHTIKEELPAPKEEITPKPEDITPPSLERATPTGGEIEHTDTGYTDEQLKDLRTKNPKEYFRLIREGKI